MGREFLHLTPVDEAIALFRQHFPDAPAREEVPLEQALERVLAADVVAGEDLPAWPRAVVDGYAVQAKSVRGAAGTRPTYLKLVGEVAMGQPAGLSVGQGECVRIATGGMLPQGADAVVMVEHTDLLDAATVEVGRATSEWEGVNRAGEDFRQGQLLLPAGTRLRPQELAVLAAAGVVRVPCARRLTAALISTGDELVEAGQVPAPGQVRDVNTAAIAACLLRAGLVPTVLGLFPDDRALLAAALERAVAAHDVVLISGGSSVGKADHTYDLIQGLRKPDEGGRAPRSQASQGPGRSPGSMRIRTPGEGSTSTETARHDEPGVFVHGLAIKPGKPTLLARACGKPIFGLPGHPASSLTVFTAVIGPCLAHLAGERARPRTAWALLGRPVRSGPGKDEYVKVRLTAVEEGWRADPVFGQSGNVLALAQADGLVRIPLDSEGLSEGALVEVQFL